MFLNNTFKERCFKELIKTFLPLFLLVFISSSVVAAPYESYIFNFWGQRIPSAQAYLPATFIDGVSLGVGNLDRPRDFAVALDGSIYLLDSGNNRLIGLNPDFSLGLELTTFINNGEEDRFSNPNGIAVSEDGDLYIADTGNGRIVVLDSEGQLQRIIGSPQLGQGQNALPADIIYQPRKVEVDPIGRIYVIAANVYEGILQFDAGGNFRGFIGSPKVSPSVADLFWLKIATDEQRQQTSLFLPIEYVNFAVSSRGMLYSLVRGNYDTAGEEMVKQLNPTGVDIMRRNEALPIIGDLEFGGIRYDLLGSYNNVPLSSFVDVVGRENDMFSLLDSTRGRIFTYDHNGELLYVFGGLGDVLGRFRNPMAIDRVGDTLLVLDNRGITIFEPTEYAIAIHSALDLYHQGRYEESGIMWQDVLDRNPNFELAYSAIATNALRDGNNELAMEYFRLGQNRLGYSDAFAEHRHNVINEHLSTVLTVIVLLIPLIILARKFKLRQKLGKLLGISDNTGALRELAAMIEADPREVLRKKRFEYKIRKYIDSLWYATYVMFHPFDGYWDLKHEKRGTVAAANTLLTLLVLTWVFMRQYTAFTFNELDLKTINIFSDASSILVPFLLWVGVNWAFTTLMEGKGSMKDIYLMSAYAFTPFIIFNIPTTLIGHFLTQPEGELLTLVTVVSVIWSLGLLFFGTMTTHEYTGTKTVLTTILIIGGIATALFVGLLFTSLVDHILRFVITIYTEFTYRI